ncbi:MAG: PepSY-like domain-containing protein [Lacibacter sp.]|jgi:hypothetical protein|nr:PepSY-like domain-containing protein [Lacibacter sp.]
MKQFITLGLFLLGSLMGFAQGNGKEKNKDKQKLDKTAQTKSGKNNSNTGQHNENTADTKQNGNSKSRTNLPTKVSSAFAGDYPNAVNATWTKNRGDWTVLFGNGAWRSTATYHSNGERVDTRTPMTREQAPKSVMDEILRRYPKQSPTDVIKIEKPKNPNLFQVIVEAAGKKKTLVLDEKGKLVSEQ